MEKRKESRNKKVSVSLKKIFVVSLQILFFLFTSCEFFENDVADFMETYTETAAIEEHSFNVETYNDGQNQLCISSWENTEISLFMRNPKNFQLNPSVSFSELGAQFNRNEVRINQIDRFTIKLELPQSFLIPVDGGQNITAEINLYEPMSGRTFDKYKIDLHCNTTPPEILNPTILNNNNQTFAIAFDMPNEEEVAIRHKDLSEVIINGKSYPVRVTTALDSEGVSYAVYTFEDSHFTRTAAASFTAINGKTFSHNRTSVYYETEEPFYAGNKEYSIVLKDSAGLTSTVKASTSISKLEKPVLKNQQGGVIVESINGSFTGLPFDEDTERGRVTIIPPSRDHLGNAVSGAVVYYKIYEATGSGLLYSSGSTAVEKTIELPQNTYRVEAYAGLTNYENSATTTVKFRFLNNALFVKGGVTPGEGDGSELAPLASIEEAINSINDPLRTRRESKFVIYVEGELDEDVNISGTIETDEIEILKKFGADSAVIKSLSLGSSSPTEPLLQDFKLTIGNITVKNTDSSGVGITVNENIDFVIDGATIKECGSHGLEVKNGTKAKITGGSITENTGAGIYISNGAACTITGGSITLNQAGGIDLSSGGILNMSDSPVVQNNTAGSPAVSKNVSLPASGKINIIDALDSSARIWVTSATSPAGSTSVSITQGYSTYNSRAPGYNFFSDKGYGVMLSSTEAALSQSYGGITSLYDYNVTFKPGDAASASSYNQNEFNTTITTSENKVITVAPVITRNGVDITNEVPEGDLQWHIFVTCHQDEVVNSSTNSITINKDYIMNDVYYVHINLIYMGRLFDRAIRLEGDQQAILFESYSMADLKTLIESIENDAVILMPHGLTQNNRSGMTINVPPGKTVTLVRDSGYTGTLLAAGSHPRELRINTEDDSGTLVLDGGSEAGIVATAPLFQDNCGCGNIYNVTFKNNNNENGNGGGIAGGRDTGTTLHNCHFVNCWAYNGGAGYFQSNMRLTADCTITNCGAYNKGGGLYLIAVSNSRDSYIGNNYSDISTIITGCSAVNGGNRIYADGNRYTVILYWHASDEHTYNTGTPID